MTAWLRLVDDYDAVLALCGGAEHGWGSATDYCGELFEIAAKPASELFEIAGPAETRATHTHKARAREPHAQDSCTATNAAFL